MLFPDMDPLLFSAAIPLAGLVIGLILPDALNRLRWGFTVVTSAITLDFAIRVMVLTTSGRLLTGGEDLSLIVLGPFVSADKVVSLFMADNLTALILVAVATAAFLVSIYIYEIPANYGNGRAFHCCFLLGLAGTNIAVMAGSVLVLVTGWMLTSLSLLLLTSRGQDTTPGLSSAWFRTAVLTGLGDAALLLGAFIMLYTNPEIVESMTGVFSKGLLMTMGNHGTAETFFIVAMIAAVASKAACVPFHSWLPKLSAKTPAALSTFVPAVSGIALGTYVLARLTMFLYRQYSLPVWAWEILLAVGVVTMLWGILTAAAENDLRKILAGLTFSQMGLAIVGIGTGVSAGTTGGVVQAINAIVFMPALFMVAGNIEHSTGLTQINQMKGLGRKMSSTSIAFLLAAAAATGIPPANGFTSRWMIFQSLIEIGRPILLLFVMIGTAATLVVFVRIGWQLFMPIDRHSVAAPVHMPAPMTASALMLGLVALVTGVAPWLTTSLLGVLPGQAEGLWAPAWALVLVLASIMAAVALVLSPNLSRVRGTETQETAVAKPIAHTTEDLLESFQRSAAVLANEKYDIYILISKTIAGIRDSIGDGRGGRVSRYVAYAFLGLAAIMSAIGVWNL